MEQPAKIYFYPNGHVSAFDTDNQRIEEIENKGWMELYFEYLESLGLDPTTIQFTGMHGESWMSITPFRTDYGWNVKLQKTEQ